jgi:hypothetical protein
VSPILGIWASQNYPRITNSYESIATVSVGSGGQATAEFTSIPGTYTHLQLRALARTDYAAASIAFHINFNSNAATNYSSHELTGNGTGAAATASTTTQYPVLGDITGSSATASVFGAVVLDILDYANTNKYKTIRSLSGNDRNGSGKLGLYSGNWRNTNAITSIQIIPGAGDFIQYTQFALYGIKGV